MRIPILVTLDENYISQLRVLMTSIYINHPGQQFDLYLIHSRISQEEMQVLDGQMKRLHFNLYPIKAEESAFENAKVTSRYPKEMYYRLLASTWLPEELDKIIYLDPDILVINPLYDLWNMDMEGWMFAAAAHTGKTEIANDFNKMRLQTDNDYYNSGVLLMNLKLAREKMNIHRITKYIEKCSSDFMLPDQDILNVMYGDQILEIEDVKWNYDARNYSNYLIRSNGRYKLDWIMKNTSILHFCGKDKPWKKSYRKRFGLLYKHYESLTRLYMSCDI